MSFFVSSSAITGSFSTGTGAAASGGLNAGLAVTEVSDSVAAISVLKIKAALAATEGADTVASASTIFTPGTVVIRATNNDGAYLDPSQTDNTITLSNGGLTARKNNTTGVAHTVGNMGKVTGKWRFQVTIDAHPAAEIGIGLSSLYFSRTNYLGDSINSISHVSDGRVVYSNSSVANYGALSAGMVIDIYVDADAKKVWYGRNGTISGDPVAGTGGLALPSFPKAFYPHIYMYIANSQVTMNFTGPFTYTGAAGYAPWGVGHVMAADRDNFRGALMYIRSTGYFAHAMAEFRISQTAGGTNLLLGGTATASTSLAGVGPERAFDGNSATDWEAQPSGNSATQGPAWIAVDLGTQAARNARFFAVQARNGTSGEADQAPVLFDLYLTADNVSWEKVQGTIVLNKFIGATPGGIQELPLLASVRAYPEANDTLGSASIIKARAAVAKAESNDTLSSASRVKMTGACAAVEEADSLFATNYSVDGAAIQTASPRALYSLRLVNTSYTGPAIKVRRSSDNSTLDINYSAGELDTSALMTFVGSGSGYIDTWFDQSGNARHATQATAARQPQIVNSGVLCAKNGKAAAYFSGTNAINFTFLTMPFCFADSAYTTVTTAAYENFGKWGGVHGFDFTSSGRCQIGFSNIGYPDLTRQGLVDQAAIDSPPTTSGALAILTTSSPQAFSATEGATVLLALNGANGMRVSVTGYSGNLPTTSWIGGEDMIGYIRETALYGSELPLATRKNVELAMCHPARATFRHNAVTGTAFGLTGLKSVCSMRRIVYDYKGACIVAKRSTDSSLLRVGFNSSGDLDTATLLAWAGTSTVTVAAWMDQSGQGNGWYHDTAGPNIVTSGVLNTITGSIPTASFDSTRYMRSGFVPMDGPFTTALMMNRTGGSWGALISRPTNGPPLSLGLYASNPTRPDLQRNGSSDAGGSQTITWNAPHILVYRGTTGFTTGNYTVSPSVDGADGSSLTLSYGTNTKTTKIATLGISAGLGDQYVGGLSEVIMTDTSLPVADLNSIEVDMAVKYSVTGMRRAVAALVEGDDTVSSYAGFFVEHTRVPAGDMQSGSDVRDVAGDAQTGTDIRVIKERIL